MRVINTFNRFVVAFATLCASAAGSQTYTVQSITAPAFGTVAAAASGATAFELNESTGAVTVTSGSGGRVGGTTARATVTIRCADGSGAPRRCNNSSNKALIKVGASGSPTGRAQALSAFDAVSGTGTVSAESGPAGDGSMTFQLSGWSAAGNRTFYLGMRMPIKGDNQGGATGLARSGFYVRAALNPTTPTNGSTANATATVRRALTVSKISDLAFGAVARPASGSGTVTIDPASGTRTAGGASPPILVSGPAFGRAAFTITGESGTAFTISGPSSFDMTNGASTITVTLSATAFGAQTLTGGSLVLGAGGTMTVASTTPTGAYTGTFVSTVAYN